MAPERASDYPPPLFTRSYEKLPDEIGVDVVVALPRRERLEKAILRRRESIKVAGGSGGRTEVVGNMPISSCSKNGVFLT